MISLESSLYDLGDLIVDKGEFLTDLIFIVQGECDLYGIDKLKNGDKIRQKVVRLKEGSWFGDYQILLDVKSTWQMEASQVSKNTKGLHKIPAGKVQVFKLNKDMFMDTCNRYPEFRRWLLMRANLRRCHFMKVFEENRHIFLLQEKIDQLKKYNHEMGLDHNNNIFDTEEDQWGESLKRLDTHELAYKQMRQKLMREFHEFR